MLIRTTFYQETANLAWDAIEAIVDGESRPTRQLICGAVIATKIVRWTAIVKIPGSAIAVQVAEACWHTFIHLDVADHAGASPKPSSTATQSAPAAVIVKRGLRQGLVAPVI